MQIRIIQIVPAQKTTSIYRDCQACSQYPSPSVNSIRGRAAVNETSFLWRKIILMQINCLNLGVQRKKLDEISTIIFKCNHKPDI